MPTVARWSRRGANHPHEGSGDPPVRRAAAGVGPTIPMRGQELTFSDSHMICDAANHPHEGSGDR